MNGEVDPPFRQAMITQVARDLGVRSEVLRRRVRQAEADQGKQDPETSKAPRRPLNYSCSAQRRRLSPGPPGRKPEIGQSELLAATGDPATAHVEHAHDDPADEKHDGCCNQDPANTRDVERTGHELTEDHTGDHRSEKREIRGSTRCH